MAQLLSRARQVEAEMREQKGERYRPLELCYFSRIVSLVLCVCKEIWNGNALHGSSGSMKDTRLF